MGLALVPDAFDPHVSLVYCDDAPRARAAYTAAYADDDFIGCDMTFSTLSVWQTSGPVDTWQCKFVLQRDV